MTGSTGLPRRQLRNVAVYAPAVSVAGLPRRQLRNEKAEKPERKKAGLPRRQLRKVWQSLG